MREAMRRTRVGTFLAAIAVLGALVAAPAAARAEVVVFDAILQGAQEVPPVTTPASGRASVFFDTVSRRLDWIIVHDVASPTAAHFHGPGFPGEAVGIKIPIGTASPEVAMATVDPADVADVLAGRWYINIHSGNCPTCGDGEIRGQLAARGAGTPVAVFPPSGELGQTQALDIGIFVTPPPGETVTGGSFRFDGLEVTSAFVACPLRVGTPLAPAGGLLLLCAVPGGVLPVGEHLFDARFDFSGGGSAGTTAVWDVKANTE
ncbi:MAG: CHRD domain-containing protein [Candidatus Rokuibacteriota bacterium]